MEDKIVNIEDDIEINVGVSDSTHVTVDQRIKNVIADVDKIETDIGFSEATGHVSVDSRITSITTDITNIQSDIGYDTATSQYTGLNTRLVLTIPSTMWKFQNFPTIQIFCETNFDDLTVSKCVILTIFKALKLNFNEFLLFLVAEIFIKLQVKSEKLQNPLISTLCDLFDFLSI